MNWELPEEQRRRRSAAMELGRAWASRRVELRRLTYHHGLHHPQFWACLQEAGFLGLLVPGELGGMGGGLLDAVVVLEGLAEGGTPTPFPVLTHSLAFMLDRVALPALRERILPEVAAGRCLLALVFTEKEAGHDFFTMETTVRVRGGGYTVDGTKSYISGVELAHWLFVVGRADLSRTEETSTDQGRYRAPGKPALTGVLIDRRAPGVIVEEIDMGGREGVRQWQVHFRDVPVSPEDVVGSPGGALSYLFDVFNVERLLYTALMLGVAEYWLREAASFARSRRVFDAALWERQAISHPLARMHARLHAARLATYRAAAHFDTATRELATTGSEATSAAAEVSIAKLLVADAAHDVTDCALQTYGGRGFDRTLGLLDDHLDTRLFRSAPISQELTLAHIAQHLNTASSR